MPNKRKKKNKNKQKLQTRIKKQEMGNRMATKHDLTSSLMILFIEQLIQTLKYEYNNWVVNI